MKKTAILTLLLSLAAAAFSQVDTIFWRQRESTYYYWGTQFADCHPDPGSSYTFYGASYIHARRCYIDTSLKVIGIAAPSTKDTCDPEAYPFGADTNYEPEYFHLYEATEDSFYLVAEARYDTNHPRYRMAMPNMYSSWDTIWEEYPFIYEAYFDKPYVVRDSFYVGVTTFNNDSYYDEELMRYRGLGHYFTLYYKIGTAYDVDSACDVYKRKATNPFDRCHDCEDDEWVRVGQIRYAAGWVYMPTTSFYPFFPIFDTSGLDIHGFRWVGECDTVFGLSLLYFEDDKAYLSWNTSYYAQWWELSYGPVGITPEEGIRDTSHTTMTCLENLQPNVEYIVYIRARCTDDTRGPWGTFITFILPDANGIGQARQQTNVDRHTYLMPNPTTGPVTVFSGFKISNIEVYDLAGKLIETHTVNANATTLNTSGLPSGAYLLRIRTTYGDTAKRLIKK
ncbi:MAG: T9SS type A sorting domain-containing protein [Bacteroidales bacterium]|nr:T9SS type A sorting domain-containing protein [Bacteroidales bacterium]